MLFPHVKKTNASLSFQPSILRARILGVHGAPLEVGTRLKSPEVSQIFPMKSSISDGKTSFLNGKIWAHIS
jgi:hypothetical protein